MFSCGDDGNIFSYHVNFEEETDYIIPWRERIASPGIVSLNYFFATKYYIWARGRMDAGGGASS
jgi:hypothetical protein